MDTTYRVRFRATQSNSDKAALLVEDRCGTLYLFSDDRLQVRFDQAGWLSRVDALLERAHNRWLPVESDEHLSLDQLSAAAATPWPIAYHDDHPTIG